MATATAPKKSVTAVAATVAGPMLTLTFGNGQSISLDANRLHPDIQAQAMMHGLKQKLIDAAAIARDPETGRTATLDDKYKAVAEVFDRITHATEPTWNKVRGNGGGEGNGNAKGGLLLRAMMRITSKSRQAISDYLEGLNKEQVAALRKNPRVAEMIAVIQAEQANTSGIDSDSLLDSLLDGAEPGDAADDDSDEETAAVPEDAPKLEVVEAPAPKSKRAPKPKA